MTAPQYDYGHAGFSTSAGARNAAAFANPLGPGGMNPRNVDIPTMGWVLIFVAVAFAIYHFGLLKR